jgi:ABC-type Fe3+-hydroxamate transport system substrate-binding protein
VLTGLDIPAVVNRRVVRLDDPLAMLPSTSMPRVAMKMARLLHPQLADQIDTLANQP